LYEGTTCRAYSSRTWGEEIVGVVFKGKS